MSVNRYQAVRSNWLTTWGGQHLSRLILHYLNVDNIVRILVVKIGAEDYPMTMYIRITEKIQGKRTNSYKGIVEDPYWPGHYGICFENGDERMFSDQHICEIPLEWKGNESLSKIANNFLAPLKPENNAPHGK